jgi:hypothetical protein
MTYPGALTGRALGQCWSIQTFHPRLTSPGAAEVMAPCTLLAMFTGNIIIEASGTGRPPSAITLPLIRVAESLSGAGCWEVCGSAGGGFLGV